MNLAGNVPINKVGELSPLIFALIWGPSGAGKTTLAATLPGRKLLINFDPGGYGSVADRDDIDVADYSSVGSDVAEQFKTDANPLGIRNTVELYDSYIVDSLTTVGELTVDRGIKLTKGATVERPSPGAYGARNALILKLVSNMLKFASSHGKHIAFIAHQGAPVSNEEGSVVSLPMYLGGQLPSQTSLRFSEVWALYDLPSSGKHIGIRPCRMREPMKSRMFDTRTEYEFPWTYDPVTHEGDTIADWHDKWIDGGKKKLAIPKKRK